MRPSPITSAISKPFSFRCAECAAHTQTDRDPGARADLDGAPFAAYYCGRCAARLTPPECDGAGFYAAIVAAGIPTDHHESDLYVLATQEAREIAKRHGKRGEAFKANDDGRIWLDFPFCYAPFWENVARASRERGA